MDTAALAGLIFYLQLLYLFNFDFILSDIRSMKYLSIDIETLGLDHANNDIIEFGAVYDDLNNPKPLEELPRFHRYIYRTNDVYRGSAYAMSMHSAILKKIASRNSKNNTDKFCLRRTLGIHLRSWFGEIGWKPDELGFFKLNVAGKNFGNFDMRFLDLPEYEWAGHQIYWPHRFIDPTMLYFELGDAELPSSKVCMERAGIKGEVAHTSVDDALMVVQLLRKKLL